MFICCALKKATVDFCIVLADVILSWIEWMTHHMYMEARGRGILSEDHQNNRKWCVSVTGDRTVRPG